MPIIEVTLAEGRPPEKLRRLITALTDAVVDTDVAPKSSVRVLLREIPPTHFAAADETLAERAERVARENENQQSSPSENNPEGT